MRRVSAALLAALLLIGCGISANVTRYVGPRFVTPNGEVAAVDVDRGGRIVALHAERPDDSVTDIVQVPGALALPGLHDAHLHLAGVGRRAELLDLRGSQSPREVRERVAAYVTAHPDVAVVRGRGWDQSLFPDRRFPTWRELEGISAKPMLLTRVDGHAVWANRALLDLAGISAATVDPEGGRLHRDAEGAPTGVLIDNAIDLLREHLPEPTDADRRRWVSVGAQACADVGLVAVHDMGMDVATLRALETVDRQHHLPLRVFVYLADDAASYEWLESGAARRRTGRIEVRGVKLYADGALGSRGAALVDDYHDEKGRRGALLTNPEELTRRAQRVHAAGAQVAIHAIGDLAVRVALDAIRDAQGPSHVRRHRVEHAQVVSPQDLPRFARLAAVASMQPTHATSDMRWAEARLGVERLWGAYAWRRMLDGGVLLALGSDAPVESHRPLLGLYAAITRQDERGEPKAGWLPGQRLSFVEALRGFTQSAAAAVQREGELGTLSLGHALDVTVLGADPRGAPSKLLEVKPVATIVSGRVRRIGP